MIGSFRHRVTFQDPGPAVPDGVGGYSQEWEDLAPPTWFVSITPAAAHDLERIASGSVVTSTTYLVRGRYHRGVSTKTRMLHDGQTFAITGTRPADPHKTLMELTAVEVVAKEQP
jgi:head-tail adaptor